MKLSDAFQKDKTKRDRLTCWCRKCGNERSEHWRKDNLEKAREAVRRCIRANPEKNRERARQWLKAHPDKKYEAIQRWGKAHPERIRKLWRKAGIKKGSTPKGKLNRNMGKAISTALRGNKAGRHWELLVDFTLNQLKQHLKKHFQFGMTWANYGEWHIDHTIPKSVFNYKTAEDIDFRECWNLKNLKPMWARDNIRKKNKLNKPFQPSLIF